MHTKPRIAIFSIPEFGVMTEFAAGAVALGYKPVWRNPDCFTGDDQFEPGFDAVVLNGLRGNNPKVRATYQAKGVPVIITDLGHLDRKAGYFQVGLGRLGWVPPFACPPDRLARLNLPFHTPVAHSKDAPFVILGQMPGDAQHGMSPGQLEDMYAAWIALIRTQTDRPVWYRPHPVRDINIAEVQVRNVARVLDPEEPIQQMVHGGIHAVVTHNSGAALHALIAGVPVYCHESAMYAEVANTDMSVGKAPFFPGNEQRQAFFARLAYAQWTRAEVESGEAVRFILDVAKNGLPTFMGVDLASGPDRTVAVAFDSTGFIKSYTPAEIEAMRAAGQLRETRTPRARENGATRPTLPDEDEIDDAKTYVVERIKGGQIVERLSGVPGAKLRSMVRDSADEGFDVTEEVTETELTAEDCGKEPLAGPEHGVTPQPAKRGRGRPPKHGKYAGQKKKPAAETPAADVAAGAVTEVQNASVVDTVADAVGGAVDAIGDAIGGVLD